MIATLVTLVAAFSWINRRFLHLPTAIGLMLIALVFSLGLLALGAAVQQPFVAWVRSIDFGEAFLHGMLGALLFAGALQVDIDDLLAHRRFVAILATAGVAITAAAIGTISYWILHGLGLPVSFAGCLLFGALLAPTDPVAVLAILRDAHVPAGLETKLVGEALFNDGFGVVLFLLISEVAASGHGVSGSAALLLFVREACGGLAFGALLGVLAYRMLKSVDDHPVEILVTLAVVTGGYALAQRLHLSGPLSMVVAGLFVGNRGRRYAMSQRTRDELDAFWSLIDAFLNAILFVLIGLEVAALDFEPASLVAALVVIPLLLATRFLTVGATVHLLRRRQTLEPHAVTILTWSGVRGGISVALALSLPGGTERDLFVAGTYLVVGASLVLQGLTLGRLVRRLGAA